MAAVFLSGVRCSFQQFKLMHDLLDPSKYNRNIRPVSNDDQPVNVTFRMNLYQLLNVNEPNQNVVLYVWVTEYWTDMFLGWDPKLYGGVTTTVLPYDQVWIPDTCLYNSLQMTRTEVERWISVRYITQPDIRTPTNFSANATFMFPAIYTFSCKMDIQLFPFDRQNCSMVFSSWTYDSSGIDYTAHRDRVTFESYVENEEWELISFLFHRNVVQFNCCPVPWSLMEVYLVIQRKPLYYVANLMVPTAVITLIAVVGFFMPASTTGERTEKVNLGITTLLAMSILLLMVADQIPTTSDYIPLMGWFFLSIIGLVSLGTIMTSVIISVQKRGLSGKRVPPRVRKLFFRGCARALRVASPRDMKVLDNNQLDSDTETVANTFFHGRHISRAEATPLVRLNSVNPRKRHALRRQAVHLSPGVPLTPRSYSQNNTFEQVRSRKTSEFHSPPNFLPDSGLRILDDIEESLEKLRDFVCAKEATAILSLEWEHLANILDRFCLLIFCVSCVSITLGILLHGYIVYLQHMSTKVFYAD